MSRIVAIWGPSREDAPQPEPPARDQGEPDERERALYEAYMAQQQAMAQQQQKQKPPGKAKRIIFGTLGFLMNMTMRIIGVGLIVAGGGLKLVQRAFGGGNNNGSKKMSLRSVFLGAALVAGAMVGPGVYHMTQGNEIVRTRVTGKVMADANAEFPGQKYFIYTNQGKFDTFGAVGGADIKEGCVYDFNLKSARLQAWPPSYSRSIIGYKPVPDGGCAP
ncbi:MAG: hypothetical protein EPN97_05020 [Alphaproteobacteria bacterium]|nr:MAG: hypothetical protein EPN97_05020 [Alphaproteobacteria bacterium]